MLGDEGVNEKRHKARKRERKKRNNLEEMKKNINYY